MDIKQLGGLNVRKFGEERSFSQEGLAFESSQHRTYISSVERGARNPTVSVLGGIATPWKCQHPSCLNLMLNRKENR